MAKVNILSVNVDTVTSDQAVQTIIAAMKAGQKLPIYTINTEFIMLAQKDPQFKQVLSSAGIALPDGIGVLWAGIFLSRPLQVSFKPVRVIICLTQALWTGAGVLLSPSYRAQVFPARITGVDLSYQLAKECAKEGLSIYLLGEKEGIAQAVAQRLVADFPNLRITSTYAGDGSISGDQETRMQIGNHPSDLLLVAYGAPKQEYWIHRNLSTIPVSAAMGVGGTFLYLSGQTKRAPAMWQRFGLEWLYRLLTEPWRWHRQLALPQFIWSVTRHKINQPL